MAAVPSEGREVRGAVPLSLMRAGFLAAADRTLPPGHREYGPGAFGAALADRHLRLLPGGGRARSLWTARVQASETVNSISSVDWLRGLFCDSRVMNPVRSRCRMPTLPAMALLHRPARTPRRAASAPVAGVSHARGRCSRPEGGRRPPISSVAGATDRIRTKIATCAQKWRIRRLSTMRAHQGFPDSGAPPVGWIAGAGGKPGDSRNAASYWSSPFRGARRAGDRAHVAAGHSRRMD
jgi:hypothetical protein